MQTDGESVGEKKLRIFNTELPHVINSQPDPNKSESGSDQEFRNQF
jgi:hypothetical protein